MSHRQYVRDLCLMTAAAGAMVAATVLAGPFAGVAVLAVALIAAGFAAMLADVTRKLDATDEWCARIDRELDQEKATREALRTQHTITAEPRAPVVDIHTRKPVA